MTQRIARIALIVAAGCAASQARASGGAHVVDDSEVETPGTCHLENWTSHAASASTLVSAPACTLAALPVVEWGAALTRAETAGETATTIAVTPKLNLRGEGRGLGIGLAGNVAIDARRGGAVSGGLVAAFTLPAGQRLRVNANAGAVWVETGRPAEAFAGVQVERGFGPLILMIEGFARARDRAGGQMGLRMTGDSGRIDLDLLVGRYVDGTTPTTITLGLTIRR